MKLEQWDKAIKEAVNELGEAFDTHQLIQKLAHKNQRDYVIALAEIEGEVPFQTLHSALGRQIKVICTELGFSNKDHRSLDMFNQNSKCQFWSK